VGLSAVTFAEYFRDQQRQNILLLINNIIRFVQAGSEASGLLGRLPSPVSDQPPLATEVAALQERIASVAGAAITAIEAVYVPADDFTDPAVTAISSHMEGTITGRSTPQQAEHPQAENQHGSKPHSHRLPGAVGTRTLAPSAHRQCDVSRSRVSAPGGVWGSAPASRPLDALGDM
jgi:hypothetical protein